LKKIIKSLIQSTGYDLRRHIPIANPTFQLLTALNKFKIDLVLDVGANIGQFASDLRSAGFAGELISFEPLASAHQSLIKAARKDANWSIHERCAIGDRNGSIKINVAGNSVSSSVLPMMELHRSACEISTYVDSEEVPLITLDVAAPQYLKKRHCRPFLKIDTQGFEWEVLNGAREILPQMHGVLCELSLASLYEGQHLWLDLIQRMESAGFALWCIQPGFTDHRDGRTLQLDAAFFRSPNENQCTKQK
jgi:FkbM family methyltransferase